MSAKEMFEACGYKQVQGEYGAYYINYMKKEKRRIEGLLFEYTLSIWFDKETKTFTKDIKEGEGIYSSDFINMFELKAIQKQIEELGWV